METSKAIPIQQNQIQPEKEGVVLPADELKKLTDFFSILIQIDQKNKSRIKKNDNI